MAATESGVQRAGPGQDRRKSAIGLIVVTIVAAVLTSYFSLPPPSNVCAGAKIGQITYTRDPSNPLILDHAEGSAVKIGDNYFLYYRIDQTTRPGQENSSIALSESFNGFNWTDVNVVLNRSSTGWDSAEVIAPSILSDGGIFYLYYEADDAFHPGNRAIGVAVSPNVEGPFVKYDGNPILKPSEEWETTAVGTPAVVKGDAGYYMFYHGFSAGSDRVGVAYSASPLGPWTKDSNNPILNVGLPGSWNSKKVAPSSAIAMRNFIWIYYEGFDGTNEATQTSWRIGLARASLDSKGRITCAVQTGSVLGLGHANTFDNNTVQSPSMLVEGSRTVMYYSGHDGRAFWLGRAIGPLPWTA